MSDDSRQKSRMLDAVQEAEDLAELKAARKEHKRATAVRAATDELEQRTRENKRIGECLTTVHEQLLPAALQSIAETLELDYAEPETTWLEKPDHGGCTSIVLARTTAHTIRIAAETSIRERLLGSSARKFAIKITAERVVSENRLLQTFAKWKGQARISKESNTFALADLEVDSALSRVPIWLDSAARETAAKIAEVLTEEGR